MTPRRRGGYVRDGDDVITRECEHCEWLVEANSYPELIEQYQDHLREAHPKAWMRV